MHLRPDRWLVTSSSAWHGIRIPQVFCFGLRGRARWNDALAGGRNFRACPIMPLPSLALARVANRSVSSGCRSVNAHICMQSMLVPGYRASATFRARGRPRELREGRSARRSHWPARAPAAGRWTPRPGPQTTMSAAVCHSIGRSGAGGPLAAAGSHLPRPPQPRHGGAGHESSRPGLPHAGGSHQDGALWRSIRPHGAPHGLGVRAQSWSMQSLNVRHGVPDSLAATSPSGAATQSHLLVFAQAVQLCDRCMHPLPPRCPRD